MYVVRANMWWCAVRRGVLGNGATKVAHDPIFNVERIACCSRTGVYIRVFPERRQQLDAAFLIPFGFYKGQQQQRGAGPRT
jgi:hypothetical protein